LPILDAWFWNTAPASTRDNPPGCLAWFSIGPMPCCARFFRRALAKSMNAVRRPQTRQQKPPPPDCPPMDASPPRKTHRHHAASSRCRPLRARNADIGRMRLARIATIPLLPRLRRLARAQPAAAAAAATGNAIFA
jgi:hypothetical protein